jgi:Zn-dependent M28 family amino/carboxypeptidase
MPGTQAASAELRDAEVVFVGYGITAPEQGWDDFKDVDVRGKVLLVMNNDPESDPSLFAGKTRLYYGRWSYKYEEAARRGARAAIIIHTDASAGYPWQVVETSWAGERFELPQGDEPRLQVKLWATEDATRRMVRAGGRDLDELRRQAERRDFRPVPLGVKMSLRIESAVRRLETGNVLAVLPGTGALAGEMVVVTAHHDHLGMRGGAIYNGAVDNASGVAGMLALAEALGRGARPRRSILFAAVGVEESGLLGSAYLAANPPVPAGRLAACFNLDGMNVLGRTRDVQVLGLGKSDLDDVLGPLIRAQGRRMVPDLQPDRGYFYRSDQFNFAKIGVPSVAVGRGLDYVGREPGWGEARVAEYIAKRYHQPSDVIDDSWNLEGAVDDLRLVAAAILRVADAARAPSWRPGDEFEEARRRALGQAR